MKSRIDVCVKGLRYIACLLVVLVGIAAIIGSADGDGDDDKEESNESLRVAGESGQLVDLDGQWEQKCQTFGVDGEFSYNVFYEFTGAEISGSITMWDTPDCSATEKSNVLLKINLNLGEEVSAAYNNENVTATVVDTTIVSYKITYYDQTSIDILNQKEYCGFNDWTIDVPKEVSGRECDEETMPDGNSKTILYLDDTTTPNTIYFGESEGETNENGYPVEIDADSGMTKK